MMHRRHFLRLLPAAALCSCGNDHPASGGKVPKAKRLVTSTTRFTADLVSNIGGDALDSHCFLPVGANPHTFTPDALDLSKLFTSDVVLVHGLGLENRWSIDLPALVKSGVRVFTVTDGIAPERLIRPSGPGGPPDPHVWTDPELAVHLATSVEEALKICRPKLTDYFIPRAYSQRLKFKDAQNYNADKLKALKPKDRFLLTSHDTMQYFAKACGLEARALCPAGGAIPDKLPDDLLTWIRSHDVKSLFREPSTDVIALRNLVRDAGVDPDHLIYSLTLGAPGTTGTVSIKNYDVATATGALRFNSDSIVATLEVD